MVCTLADFLLTEKQQIFTKTTDLLTSWGASTKGLIKLWKFFWPNAWFACLNCLNINVCFRDWWSGGVQASSQKQVINGLDNILYLLKCSNELILSLRMTWYFLHNQDIWRDNLWNCDILWEFINLKGFKFTLDF